MRPIATNIAAELGESAVAAIESLESFPFPQIREAALDHHENTAESHAIAAGHYGNQALDHLDRSRHVLDRLFERRR